MARRYDKTKVKEVSVKFNRRVSKNYQSMEIGIEQTMTLEEGDDVVDIREAMLEDLSTFMDDALDQIPIDPFDE